jgi:hypothetical protein
MALGALAVSYFVALTALALFVLAFLTSMGVLVLRTLAALVFLGAFDLISLAALMALGSSGLLPGLFALSPLVTALIVFALTLPTALAPAETLAVYLALGLTFSTFRSVRPL